MVILNRALIHDIPEPLRIGIGIHTGPAIVGEMGYGTAVSITAVGDSVNTASRIEAAVKGTTANLLVSEAVHGHIKDHVQTGIDVDTVLKGKHGTYKLYEVVRVR